jgi:hypothetical protein
MEAVQSHLTSSLSEAQLKVRVDSESRQGYLGNTSNVTNNNTKSAPNAPDYTIVAIPGGSVPSSFIAEFREAVTLLSQTQRNRELGNDSHVESAYRSDKASPTIVNIDSQEFPEYVDVNTQQPRSSSLSARSVLTSDNGKVF